MCNDKIVVVPVMYVRAFIFPILQFAENLLRKTFCMNYFIHVVKAIWNNLREIWVICLRKIEW